MALIINFEQLREHVKFIASSDPASGFLNTNAAEIKYVLPILGVELYSYLNVAVATNSVADGYITLLGLCRAVAAPMAVYHNLALIQTNITDTGLKTSSTENFDAAHRWEYMEVKEALLDQASLATESLITYLVLNATMFSWVNPAYGSIILTGTEFNEYYPLNQPHRTFFMLRPLVKEAEGKLIAIMGLAYLTELKALTSASDVEANALELAKKFVVNYAINKALEKLSVQVTPQGFTVMLAATDQPADGRANAPDNQLSLLYNSTKEDAKLYLGRLKSYLNLKASSTVFETYFASDYYVNPLTADKPNLNCRRRGIFSL